MGDIDLKQQFITELVQFLTKLDKIDNQTPYSVTEPAWWIEMSDLSRYIHSIKNKLTN